MKDVHAIAEHLIARHLFPLLHRGNFGRLPDVARSAELPKDYLATIQRITVTATNKETPIAEIPVDCDTNVELSHGYLCERWCSVFRLMKIVFRLPNAFEQFERETSFGQDIPFEWPWDVPTPDTRGNHVVDAANRYLLRVVSATILHEIGHVFARATAQNGREAELQADTFAMEYLLGDEKPTGGSEVRTVGVLLWLCSLCSESLRDAPLGSTHPSPVDRATAFLENYVYPHWSTAPALMESTEGIIALHVHNLAQLRRREAFEYAMDEFRRRDSGDPRVMLECLRPCWQW